MSRVVAAVYLRVSDPGSGQTVENQRPPLEALAVARGYEIVHVYEDGESAWKGGGRPALLEALEDARRGRYQVLLVWSLDRLSREGIASMLELLNTFTKYGVKVISLQESWTEVDGDLRDLLISIVAWVARMESQRRSERTKAGMDRVRRQGKTIGRPKGKQDSGNTTRQRKARAKREG